MNTLSYKTISANAKTAHKEWVVVDVKDLPLGRVATVIANFLRGKYKTNYTPHVDCGDNVIVVNASTVTLSGKKWEQKEYVRHTGYPGGQRILNATQLHNKKDTRWGPCACLNQMDFFEKSSHLVETKRGGAIQVGQQ